MRAPRRSEGQAPPIAGDPDVYVGDRPDRQELVESTESAGGNGQVDLGVANREDCGAFGRMDVDACVKSLASFAARVSTRLTNGAGHFVRSLERFDRPDERRPREADQIEAR
jgi:hypothetical protein